MAIAVMVGAATAIIVRLPSKPPALKRLTFAAPPGVAPVSGSFQSLALAPSGDRLAFIGLSSQGLPRRGGLYIHSIGEIEARPVLGTDFADTPFFSPDGRWLAFAQKDPGGRGLLRKVALGGGEPVTITEIPQERILRGASWGQGDTIVFSPGHRAGLWRVSADGGVPRPITTVDGARGEISHRWPHVLPGGRAVIFTVESKSMQARDARIDAVSLETGERRAMVEGTGYARYSPPGNLVYAQLGTLFAVPFDVERLAVTGPATPVLDDVRMDVSAHLNAAVDVSASGALVYWPGFLRPLARSLLWVDRQGKAEAATRERRPFMTPRVSQDGRRVAVVVETEGELGNLWVLDVERDAWTALNREGRSGNPAWSPDGRWVGFSFQGMSGVELRRIGAEGGTAEQIGLPGFMSFLTAWSPDGRSLVFQAQRPGTLWDVGVLPVGAKGEARFLLEADYMECGPAVSPDGQWLAYASNESGRFEIYVRPFPGPGENYVVSTARGFQPRWSRDGRELFYRSVGDRPKLMAVAVETRAAFRAGAPRPLFDDTFAGRADVFGSFSGHYPAEYDVTPDGRFIFLEELARPVPQQLVLVPGWAEELSQKLRAAR